MKRYSIWQEYQIDNYPKLDKDIKVDILIIGGGITGINTFYQLKDDKRPIALVEKNKIGLGITARSSAKISFLQQDIYAKLTNYYDFKTARLYYESQKEAILKLKDIITKEKIDCDFEQVDSYLYACQEKEVKKVKIEEEYLRKMGEKTYPCNFKNALYSFKVKDTYVFHPLKYLSNLAKLSVNKNHQIYEFTNINEIKESKEGYICLTDNYKITCQKIVLANHYPNFIIPFYFPLKGYLEESTLSISKSNHDLFSAININNPINSYRFYQNYLLKVTDSHNLCFLKMNKDKKDNIEYIWTNQDIMTLDNLPYIGLIKKDLYIATGYNTWGMTNSLLSSLIIKDLLNKKENKYLKLFYPYRKISMIKLKNYSLNIFSNTYAFLNSKINKNKKIYQGNPIFYKKDGVSLATYKDKLGKVYTVYNKCPHLKCSLIFNQKELTWDCPCHGSRFTLEGKSIIGPSDYDITYKN